MDQIRNMSAIGDHLKQLREKCGFGVAQAANESGISAPYLYQIEDGRRNPSAKVLSRLAQVYKVRAEELLTLADLLPPSVLPQVEHETREDRITRAFEFVMQDPNIRAGSSAMQTLPTEAKLSIIRLYERAEGLKVLPDDVV